ncbi:MAG: ethanolamine utilization protein EutN [Bacteroidetes bacterium HGW-Bacteroidetes-9]|jgi:microcompartment protein CcmK/EutM|nr:MAG: ethanolamine utilization protein EutN [Bacteroidetes bacterium HGW-Bacteroidetes-9]
MILGKVVGTVVSSTDQVGISGKAFLLIEKCNQEGVLKNDFVVALDLVGAGRDEMVMVSEGSTARETPLTTCKPLDALVVGIVDIIDENDTVIYRK